MPNHYQTAIAAASGVVEWDAGTGSATTRHLEIDDGTANNNAEPGWVTTDDADYIETTTLSDAAHIGLSTSALPGNADTVTNVEVTVRGSLSDGSSSANITAILYKDSSGTPTQIGQTETITGAGTAGNFPDYAGTLGEAVLDFTGTGFPITPAEATDLEVRLTFNGT